MDNDWKWNNMVCNDIRPYGLCKIPGKISRHLF